MHQPTQDLTVVMGTPDAVIRHRTGFGSANEHDDLAAEHSRIDRETDLTALLEGTEEVDEAGDLLYRPPGHTLRVEEDAGFVPFGPLDEHTAISEHGTSGMEGWRWR